MSTEELLTRARDDALALANRRHAEAMKAAEDERAAIVYLLRQNAEVPVSLKPYTNKMEQINLELFRNVLRSAADRIERGDHLRQLPSATDL